MAKVIPIRPTQVYQLKVTLKGSKPPIWRRILVEPDVKLPDLHRIIQTGMGWTNSHLHHFTDGREFYAEPSDDDFMPVRDYRKIRLNKLLQYEKQSIRYIYDFGDNWEHEILLEKILPRDAGLQYPHCVTGKRHCPPEDCGGFWRYQELLEILADPADPDYQELVSWVGHDFDPEYFSVHDVNVCLRRKNFGCIEYDDNF
jgi:hypothetical protein